MYYHLLINKRSIFSLNLSFHFTCHDMLVVFVIFCLVVFLLVFIVFFHSSINFVDDFLSHFLPRRNNLIEPTDSYHMRKLDMNAYYPHVNVRIPQSYTDAEPMQRLKIVKRRTNNLNDSTNSRSSIRSHSQLMDHSIKRKDGTSLLDIPPPSPSPPPSQVIYPSPHVSPPRESILMNPIQREEIEQSPPIRQMYSHLIPSSVSSSTQSSSVSSSSTASSSVSSSTASSPQSSSRSSSMSSREPSPQPVRRQRFSNNQRQQNNRQSDSGSGNQSSGYKGNRGNKTRGRGNYRGRGKNNYNQRSNNEDRKAGPFGK